MGAYRRRWRWTACALVACAAAALSGCGARLLARIPKGFAVSSPLSWSPDGRWLAFNLTQKAPPGERAYSNGTAVTISVAPHGELKRVCDDLNVAGPQFTPGGRGLLLTPLLRAATRVSTRDLATRKSRVLYQTPSGRRIEEAALSPDGKWLYVITLPEHGGVTPSWLVVVEVATGKSRRLWGGAQKCLVRAAFSPDSRRLLWECCPTSAKDTEPTPMRWYSSAAPFRKVLAVPAGCLSDSLEVEDDGWAPDSRRVVAWGLGRGLRLVVADLARGTSKTIVDDSGWQLQYGTGCTWSPDGRWIAYGAWRMKPGTWDQMEQCIRLASPDGAKTVTIARKTSADMVFMDLAWSPHGRRLAYQDGRRLVVAKVP